MIDGVQPKLSILTHDLECPLATHLHEQLGAVGIPVELDSNVSKTFDTNNGIVLFLSPATQTQILSLAGEIRRSLIVVGNLQQGHSQVTELTQVCDVQAWFEENEIEQIKEYIIANWDQIQGAHNSRAALDLIKGQISNLEELKTQKEGQIQKNSEMFKRSKDELLERNKDLRKLGRFSRELSEIHSIIDLVASLRKETKIFHKVQSPILLVKRPDIGADIYYFQGIEVIKNQISTVPELGQRIRINLKEDAKFLAKILNRPIPKVITIPLGLNDYSGEFYFCHDLKSGTETEQFIEFVSQRLQPLEVILESLFLEAEMRSSSVIWEKTFEGLSDPVVVIDKKYSVLRANSEFGQDGGKCFKLFAQRKEPCLGCPLITDDLGAEAMRGTIKRNEKVYEVSIYPISLELGTGTVGYFNHYVDVTKTVELKEQIIQSEKMVALGHLAGNIAHELNNPLTGVRSMCQLLLVDQDLEKQFAADLSEVAKAAQRCQSIIANLMDFSRGSEGKEETLDMDEVIESTIPMSKVAMRAFNFELDLNGKGKSVQGERHLFQQVVFNLVINACQAMKDGDSLKVKSFINQQSYFVEIEDSGAGIPEPIIGQIFDSFFTTKQVGAGTGLGLSMVKKIVEQFKGTISVESQEGQGTKFTLEFPIS